MGHIRLFWEHTEKSNGASGCPLPSDPSRARSGHPGGDCPVPWPGTLHDCSSGRPDSWGALREHFTAEGRLWSRSCLLWFSCSLDQPQGGLRLSPCGQPSGKAQKLASPVGAGPGMFLWKTVEPVKLTQRIRAP